MTKGRAPAHPACCRGRFLSVPPETFGDLIQSRTRGGILRLIIGLIATLVVSAGLLGCGGKPSIVGSWKTEWRGDNYGVTTLRFEKSGRYTWETVSGITSKRFIMRSKEFGTYTFIECRLSLHRLESRIEYLDPAGNVKKKVTMTERADTTWSKTSLTAGDLVLDGPDGAPPTGDPPQVFQREYSAPLTGRRF